ncbi:MAG: acyl-CoA dehydrogenase family protein, partial [Thermodesulfobacteriota bacterium]|nr:acyl-CoA dehydrogenase family protein [Thermodesulfobacteriota bacterium]
MNFELSEEQVMLRDMARKFAEQEMLPTLQEYEHARKVNFDVIKKMGSLGLIGAHIPREYGGAGLDYASAAIIWEQLSW